MVENYKGRPFQDTKYDGKAQKIPGRVMCAYYDLGGEGVAYHDTTKENHGSGMLNPANGDYLNEFRMNESVDTSFTKPDFDATEKNLVNPELKMFYVGWTDEGEWLNYTVDVDKSGNYSVDFLFSAAVDAAISLSVDNKDVTEKIAIPSTTHPHIWNRLSAMTTFLLEKGTHLLTLHTVEKGLMNYAFLEFKLV